MSTYSKKYILDKDGNKVLPITSTKAVMDENGNPLSSIITNLHELYISLTQSDIEVVNTVPTTGVANKIYRVIGESSYSDYMFNSSNLNTPIKMATYNNAVDEVPTADSENLVKSGGVASEIERLDVFEMESLSSEVLQPIESLDDFGIWGDAIEQSTRWKSNVYLLNPDIETSYTVPTAGQKPYIKGAVCIINNGSYEIVDRNDIVSEDGIPAALTVGDLSDIVFKGNLYAADITKQLYLILNKNFSGGELVSIVKTGVDSAAVIKPKDDANFDNYDYIKERACGFYGINQNAKPYKNIGMVYNTDGKIKYSVDYDCSTVPVDFGQYYRIDNYKLGSLTSSGNNMSFLVKYNGLYHQMTISDLNPESDWLAKDTLFSHTNYIWRQGLSDNLIFNTPSKSDFVNEPDELVFVFNTRFSSNLLNEAFIIVEGTDAVDSDKLASIFGYPLGNGGSGGSGGVNQINQGVVAFFGDSITEGTDGGYVNLVKEKANLSIADNYGSSGSTTTRLVDIVTGEIIRDNTKYTSKDYNKYDAVTILIGTNGGVGLTADIEKDIPDINVDDITSFPYTYEAEGKTIESATLNNADDFFKLCFANTFYGNIALCIEWIRWKNPDCKIFLITVPPQGKQNMPGSNRYYITINNAIKALGDRMSVPVIDAQANAGLGEWNISQWTLNESHGIRTHLNKKGNEMLASYIAQELKLHFYETDISSEE